MPEQLAPPPARSLGPGARVREEPAELSQEEALQALRDGSVQTVLDDLDKDLVALQEVKGRIREIAALLLIERLRAAAGLVAKPPTLHMCFTGNPGTGKTTVAMRIGDVLHRLGYVRKGHVVVVTREDLVGQYVGHTAPKTREALKRAMGGVLFIDEAYTIYRLDNERDYGQEAVELLLQAMENDRHDLVVIFAGYKDKMERFFADVPGISSRIAHHIDFPDYGDQELMEIARLMLNGENYRLSPPAERAFEDYFRRRREQPNFANGRSVRNALDRARMRHAVRLYTTALADGHTPTVEELTVIEADDILKSRVFKP
ncbi:MAG: AAA family ATPase [Candidatus Dormibacteraeota bacterium]|nr:AAA family ATPase [Candidatus Dormibacteraeota bacterium]